MKHEFISPLEKMAANLCRWHFEMQWMKSFVLIFSLRFVPKGPIYNKAALVQVMAWLSAPESKLGWSRGNIVSNTHVSVLIPWLVLNRIDKCASMAKMKLTLILCWTHDQCVHQDLCIWWVTDITNMTSIYSVIFTINVFPLQLIGVV